MSLSDLASLGSFVSGLAVLASLVFLFFQMRQMTEQVKQAEKNQQASIRQGRGATLVDLNLRVAHPEFFQAREILRGNPAEDLNAIGQFQSWAFALFHLYEESFDQHEAGLLIDSAFTSFARNARTTMSSPGFRAMWKRARGRFGDDFAAFMDDIVAKTPARKLENNVLLDQFNADLAAELAGAVPGAVA